MFVVLQDYQGARYSLLAGDVLTSSADAARRDGVLLLEVSQESATAVASAVRLARANRATAGLSASDGALFSALVSAGAIQVLAGGDPLEIWVAEGGSDAGAGTQAQPLASLDEALRRVGPVVQRETTIRLGPSSRVNGWESTELWKPRLYRAALMIDGSAHVTELVAPTTTASWTAASITYNFAGTPGWTPDAYVGQWLQYVSGGTAAYPAGQMRTIVANAAASITVTESHGNSTFPLPGAGLVFRVVTPAVRINAGQFAVGDGKGIYGGQVLGNAALNSARCALRLRGLEFAVPDGAPGQHFEVGGMVSFEGVQYTSGTPANNYRIQIAQAQIFSGEFFNLEPDTNTFGWCLSARERTGGSRLPRVEIRCGVDWRGNWCGGPFWVYQSSEALLRRSGRFDGRGHTASFPHGSIYCGKGCAVYTNGGSTSALYVAPIPGDGGFEVEHGMMEVYVPVQQFASGRFARSRHMGTLNIAANPVAISGATGLELLTAFGGQIRLVGVDGSTFGQSTTGHVVPVIRAPGAWATGEITNGSESCHIYRT